MVKKIEGYVDNQQRSPEQGNVQRLCASKSRGQWSRSQWDQDIVYSLVKAKGEQKVVRRARSECLLMNKEEYSGCSILLMVCYFQ